MNNSKTHAPVARNEAVKSYAPRTIEREQLKSEISHQKKQCAEILPSKAARSHLGGSAQIVSPHAHEHKLASVRLADQRGIEKCIEQALAVRSEWAALSWEQRASVFLKAADLLASKYRPILNASTMLGQSKTAHQAEIDAACELIDFLRFNVSFMENIFSIQPESSAGVWNRTEVRGLEGFVVAITPFNFTSIAVNLACAPALMGCVVLWKPALTSLLSSYYGMKLLEESGLPEGIIQFVPSEPKTFSDVVLNHRELSGVHFTGSTSTFNYIWQHLGQNISRYRHYPRVVGETGGKDFVFAHPSADVDELVTALVRGAFEFQGQKCSAASRAYIPQSLWNEVKEKLCSQVQSIKMGDPCEDFRNFMGAVIDKKSFDRIKTYIEGAKSDAQCKVIAGGVCNDSEGYFIQPTVIQTENPKSKTMVEEIFGPVLTVYVYDDKKIDEAIELCDSSAPYALTGAIFAQERFAIDQLTRKLVHAAGNFYINDKPTGAVVGQQPFGGSRASGTNDKAGSMYNLMRWTSLRTIKENFVSYRDYRYDFMNEK